MTEVFGFLIVAILALFFVAAVLVGFLAIGAAFYLVFALVVRYGFNKQV